MPVKMIQINFKRFFAYGAAILALALVVVIYFSLPPKDFPDREIVRIKKNMYMSQAADLLEEKGIIKSAFLYKVYSVIISGQRQVKAGDYLFEEPESALKVAIRTVYGEQGLPKIKVTFFEGMTVVDMGEALKKKIPSFDKQTFITIAKPYEGSLFPDTYYFYENSTPQDVLDTLNGTFTEKMKPILLDVQAFGKPLKDVIIMSSLVEKEVANSKDRRIVAGILWRRLSINMPLQVDASFYFLLGKPSSELTRSDLAVDSPYNLYKHTGLPPTPINNPGLSAIIDTINPTKTNYLYFLSDSKGVTHYAETLEQHNANKARYLK